MLEPLRVFILPDSEDTTLASRRTVDGRNLTGVLGRRQHASASQLLSLAELEFDHLDLRNSRRICEFVGRNSERSEGRTLERADLRGSEPRLGRAS